MIDSIEVVAARWADKRRALTAEGMEETTLDRNMLRCLLWDNWTKEQAQQIVQKSKEIKYAQDKETD